MLKLFAQNEAELLQKLTLFDITVPPIDQGRTKEHCEMWSICRLLATLAKYKYYEFPLQINKRERPDFYLKTGIKNIGIEFTEAIQQDYARVRVLPEANLQGSIIDPSLFKWGSKKKSLSQLRSIASEKKLMGPGWEGNEIEIEWTNAIFDIIQRKTIKLLSVGFERFDENWLLIYDNLNSFALDITQSCSIISARLEKYWTKDSFNKIYIESHDVFIEISENRKKVLNLISVWKR